MPEISRFLGIVIGMFFNQHGVPHFHAVYGEYKMKLGVENRAQALVQAVKRGLVSLDEDDS